MNSKLTKPVLVLATLPIACIVAYRFLKQRPIVYLAIEIGGTTTRVCLVQQNPKAKTELKILGNRILKTSTKTPEELMNYIRNNFQPSQFARIAISSFGPLCLRKGTDFGKVTAGSSPQKIPWVNYSLAGELGRVFKKPVSVETDVNASALAEHFIGFPTRGSSLAYFTVGTGVGVGLVIHDRPVHGFQHPEGGHNMQANKDRHPARGQRVAERLSLP